MANSVFVSTGQFPVTTTVAIETLIEAGVRAIELSGGTWTADLNREVSKYRNEVSLQVHNYFPPQESEFVFNLASPDWEVTGRTLECMKRSIELSSALGAQRYSVHAGFLIDPPVSFLGASWSALPRTPLSQAEEIFIKSIELLAAYAEAYNIDLLVENNVLTKGTMEQCGADVLLMASPEQIVRGLEALPESVELLMDVAHLHVTAHTLGIDPVEALRDTSMRVGGFHLSDNDGSRDSNEPISEDSWFWGLLSQSAKFATLEVRPVPNIDWVQQIGFTTSLWPI
jgi:sugar phosphate isomerase/epimerase